MWTLTTPTSFSGLKMKLTFVCMAVAATLVFWCSGSMAESVDSSAIKYEVTATTMKAPADSTNPESPKMLNGLLPKVAVCIDLDTYLWTGVFENEVANYGSHAWLINWHNGLQGMNGLKCTDETVALLLAIRLVDTDPSSSVLIRF